MVCCKFVDLFNTSSDTWKDGLIVLAQCMEMDECLFHIADKVKNFAVMYLVRSVFFLAFK